MKAICTHEQTGRMIETFFQVLDEKYSIYEKMKDLEAMKFFMILDDADPITDVIKDYLENDSPRKEFVASYFYHKWEDEFILIDGKFTEKKRLADKITAMFCKINDIIWKEGIPFFNPNNLWGTILHIIVVYGGMKEWKTKEEYIYLRKDIVYAMSLKDPLLKTHNRKTGEIKDVKDIF